MEKDGPHLGAEGGQRCNGCFLLMPTIRGLITWGTLTLKSEVPTTYSHPVGWARGRGAEDACFEDQCLIVFEFNGRVVYPYSGLANSCTKLLSLQNRSFTFVMEDNNRYCGKNPTGGRFVLLHSG